MADAKQKVLITGGSGLVGQYLIKLLDKSKYEIGVLGRSKKDIEGATSYLWDIQKGTIEDEAIKDTSIIIHLAGANLADKRWTDHQKQILRDSRIKSADLLHKSIELHNVNLKTFISASAIGYYPSSGDKWLKEDHEPSNTFIGKLCQDWEAEAFKFSNLNSRNVALRVGLVLTKEGGALPNIEKSMKFGLASYFGNGKHYYPWIHIDDLCRMIIHSNENSNINGAYNATAPNPVTNKYLVKALKKAKNSSAIVNSVPSFMLKLMLGEMGGLLLESQRCSADKIKEAGFQFNYNTIEEAFANLY